MIASDDELDLVDLRRQPRTPQPRRSCAGASSRSSSSAAPPGPSAWTTDGRVDVPAVPVTVVDVIGAGDAFTAGYLSAHLDGETASAACLASAEPSSAAFSVAGRGDWESLPAPRRTRPAQPPPRECPPMKIIAAEVIVTSPDRNFVTLKITTDDGVTGLGDATLNGRELAVAPT